MTDAAAPLPVTILGGYLGAGKTTLVNHLLRHAAGRRIAVAVNEFGALPIDGDLIEGADDNVLTLAGGCICCSFGSDLVAGMMDLAKRGGSIEHIVIEASGVALPGAIAASLELVGGVVLDAIVVVVDAETVRARAADPYMGDTITRQLADADLVILNKTDLVWEHDRRAVHEWVPIHAPSARIVDAVQSAVPPDVVLGPGGRSRFNAARERPPHVTNGYATETFSVDTVVDAALMAKELASAGLLRAKGFVRDPAGWMAVQVVGRRASVAPAPQHAAGGGRLVAIAQGRRMGRDAIEAIIAKCSVA